MSRSTASPPPERSVVSGRHCRASESEDERQPIRGGACRPVLLGARTAPKSVSRTYAADGRRETNPHSNPLEVHGDADAVRSVTRG